MTPNTRKKENTMNEKMTIEDKLQILKDFQSVRPNAERAKQIAEIESELNLAKDTIWTSAHDLCHRSIDRVNKAIAVTESRQKRQELVICRELLQDHLQDDELTEETVKGFNLYHVTPLLPKGFVN